MIARASGSPSGGRGRAHAPPPARHYRGKTRFGSSPSDGTPSTRFLTLLFPPKPSLPLPALHRESHQGGHARAGGGPSSRPQLRRHRAGASTLRARAPNPLLLDRPPPRPAVSFSWVLGQKLSSPPPSHRPNLTISSPALRRSCSVSSARAPASPPRCSSPWVRLPPASHQGYIQPFSFPYLIHCEKKNAHPRRRLTTPSSPFFPSPTLRHLPQGGAHRG